MFIIQLCLIFGTNINQLVNWNPILEKAVIVREARKDPKATSKEIKAASGSVGSKVSSTTVRRVILAAGLKAYRPVKKPLLTKQHRAARLEWAREHRNWTVDDWKKVSLICLRFSNFFTLFKNL